MYIYINSTNRCDCVSFLLSEECGNGYTEFKNQIAKEISKLFKKTFPASIVDLKDSRYCTLENNILPQVMTLGLHE